NIKIKTRIKMINFLQRVGGFL
ncbi:outer membrane protein, partial [Helicobacter pylori]